MDQDTIVAVATPEGEGGLAVVRLSGPTAFAVAERIFESRDFGPDAASHRAVYGILFSLTADGEKDCPIDQILALPLRGPHSYTGDDTVEFFCHGGRMAARQVVAACRAAGGRPAGPGEFTRRAFLNGRPIRVSATTELKQATGTALGFIERQGTKDGKGLLSFLPEWDYAYGFMDAYSYGCIARGSLDLSVNLLDKPWDCTAAACIVREAGGRYSDINGLETVHSGNIVLSNGILHDKILARLAEHIQ